jgi:hypothetical protein
MVDAFLGWKLPTDFSPDAGISFDSEYEKKWGCLQELTYYMLDKHDKWLSISYVDASQSQYRYQPNLWSGLIAGKKTIMTYNHIYLDVTT